MMKRWLTGLLLALMAAAAFALPTVNDVQAEVQKGNYAQAQTMMREVVAAKPDSAKAHYIYAEILAHNARFDEAAQEARLAKQLDPAIKFTQADKFRDFEQLLDREQARQKAARAPAATPPVNLAPSLADTPAPARMTAPREASSGIPGWVWGVGLAAIAWFAWRGFNRSRSAPMASSGPSYGAPAAATPYGATPNYGPGPMGGYGPGGVAPAASSGPGLMGVGLAAAGGVAAGMLAEKWLGNHESGGRVEPAGNAGNGLFERDSFASGPDPDAQALEDRSIDFGTGGNDWSDAGSSDSGSSSSDDGW